MSKDNLWIESQNVIYTYLTCRICNISIVKNRPGWKKAKQIHEEKEALRFE